MSSLRQFLLFSEEEEKLLRSNSKMSMSKIDSKMMEVEVKEREKIEEAGCKRPRLLSTSETT